MPAPPLIRILPPKEARPVVFAHLVEIPDGVAMELVDAKGKRMPRGSLLRLTSGGLHRIVCVDPTIGLPLDNKNRLKLADGG